ncbi:MAG: cupin domain-containing protein [Bacteroidetes bacterium]|nr:cupin domain-containing protein [Bacteroidota bacterium]MBS1629461.1 cupin domain-containing protein [Bacteroidota bacterium]
MDMKELYSGTSYKVLQVALSKGERMPLHEATSDAFLIGMKGKGRIRFSDGREVVLCAGESLLIKAHEPHEMEILEDFRSSVVLAQQGKINFGLTAAKASAA